MQIDEWNWGKITTGVITISLAVVAVTIFLYAISFFHFRNTIDIDVLSSFGEFIGGFVGVVLTFLATILIYLTYKSQKTELELNRKLFAKQNFENTFFNMVKIHQDLKYNLSCDFNEKQIAGWVSDDINRGLEIVKYYQKELKGRDFFIALKILFNDLWLYEYKESGSTCVKSKFNIAHKTYDYRHSSNKSDIQSIKDIKFKYSQFWVYFADYLGDYFKNVYHILDFISNEKAFQLNNVQDLERANKIENDFKKYSDIFQSQMNFAELFLIFYNSFEYENMRVLVKEFDFAENLHVSNLLDKEHKELIDIGNIKED